SQHVVGAQPRERTGMATKRAAPAGIEIGVEHGAAPASEGGNGQSDALRCAAVKRRTKIKAGNPLTLPLARDGPLPLPRCGRGAKHCPRTAEDLRFGWKVPGEVRWPRAYRSG